LATTDTRDHRYEGIFMRLVGAMRLAGATFSLVAWGKAEATGGANGATNAEKILGKWEATKGRISGKACYGGARHHE
jgi:hypothetical protein